jgi:hypothetical protein
VLILPNDNPGYSDEELPQFIEWASGYEEGKASRNLAKHQAWLATVPCPVLHLDGSRGLPELVGEVRHAIGGHINPT